MTTWLRRQRYGTGATRTCTSLVKLNAAKKTNAPTTCICAGSFRSTIRWMSGWCCPVCGTVAAGERCRICSDPRRDPTLICVVEEPKDIEAIERTREFRGLYHVLGGALDPINGIGPNELRIAGLMRRVAEESPGEEIAEIIIATDPNTTGEATSTYLARLLRPFPDLVVSRLASGLPMGADLEFADELTLGSALSGRRILSGGPAQAPRSGGVLRPAQDHGARRLGGGGQAHDAGDTVDREGPQLGPGPRRELGEQRRRGRVHALEGLTVEVTRVLAAMVAEHDAQVPIEAVELEAAQVHDSGLRTRRRRRPAGGRACRETRRARGP